MANQVAARLKGDDYQHLFAWFYVLELLMPRKLVRIVRVEDADAVSVDDVTIRCHPDALVADRFHQIKYHVTLQGSYSTDMLLDRGKQTASLLEKLFRSWRHLHQEDPDRAIEIHLVSNWPWSPDDEIGSYISGDNYAPIERFYERSSRTNVGKLRRRWQEHLGAAGPEFAAFCRSLRLKVGFDCWADMVERTSERMEALGLKFDDAALLLAVSIVRNWVKSAQGDIDIGVLKAALQTNDLYRPAPGEAAVHVHLTTIKEQAFDIEPEYVVDWRDHFLGTANKRGHQLKKAEDWNRLLLPELLDVEAEINQQPARLVRVRGKARLSAWLAFGHTFCGPNGYTIEIEQNGRNWRSDAATNPEFTVTSQTGDWKGETVRDADGGTAAVGICVTADVAADIRHDVLSNRPDVSSLMLLQPGCSPSPTCVASERDAVALADLVKLALRDYCRDRKVNRLLVYYCGPIAGACFLGHRLTAICPEIQIMEYDQSDRSYHPSFLLV